MSGWLRILAVLAFAAGLVSPSVARQEESEPLESELREEVEVRFVIIDALVLDSRGRTVPDLTISDFELFLDYEKVPLDTLDLFCPDGATTDARPVPRNRGRTAPAVTGPGRKIVLAVDYRHLETTGAARIIGRMKDMIRNSPAPGEELMVATLRRQLRIEQPFTSDRQEVLRTLDRLEHDMSMWRPPPQKEYDAFGFFSALTSLVELLRTYEGSKAIVLFSNLPDKIPDDPFFGPPLWALPLAFDYDRQFDRIAASAASARVAVYPVHSRGLTIRGSSSRLARLAVQTGGRFTENTNDLSLAYARAQRDLGCRYALGFYDRDPDRNRLHRVSLRILRSGHRIVHPELYRYESEADERATLDEIAYSAPILFRDDVVSGEVLPVRPVSEKRWRAIVVLRFPVGVSSRSVNVVRFGARLGNGPEAQSFDRQVSVQPDDRLREQRIVFVESVDLEPGTHDLSIVVNDPESDGPRSAVVPVELPPIPKRGLVVVGPLLLRQPDSDVIVHWATGSSEAGGADSAEGREPLPGGRLEPAAALVAITQLCLLDSGGHGSRISVDRAIRRTDGTALTTLPAVELDLTGEDRPRCAPLADELPTATLDHGSYAFEVSVRRNGSTETIRKRAGFAIGSRIDR